MKATFLQVLITFQIHALLTVVKLRIITTKRKRAKPQKEDDVFAIITLNSIINNC